MDKAAITGQPPEVITPPAAPAATVPEGSTVALSKEEHDKLVKAQADLKIAQDLQAQADKRANRLQNKLGGSSRFTPAAPANTPGQTPPVDAGAAADAEDRKAERGLMGIAIDPKYREVFDADPTLRDMITRNPLGVLPLLANDAVDADDAIELVKEKLDEKLTALKTSSRIINQTPPSTPSAPATPPATPAVPPSGGINVNGAEETPAYQEAKKIPNTDRAIASMIKEKIKFVKK